MANEHANKVIIGSDVVLDLTSDTVTAAVLRDGYTAHDASGAPITGTCKNIALVPIAYDYEMGYTDNGTYKYQDSTNNHSDFYEVLQGHRYLIGLGATVGTRFRATVVTTNPVGTTVDIVGKAVINKNNPSAYDYAVFKPEADGWLVITKDNASHTGLKSYLYDTTPEI